MNSQLDGHESGIIKIGKGLLYYAEHPRTVKLHTLTLKRLEKILTKQLKHENRNCSK